METRYDEKWVRHGSRLPASFLCVHVQGITLVASLYLCMVLDARGLPEAAFQQSLCARNMQRGVSTVLLFTEAVTHKHAC